MESDPDFVHCIHLTSAYELVFLVWLLPPSPSLLTAAMVPGSCFIIYRPNSLYPPTQPISSLEHIYLLFTKKAEIFPSHTDKKKVHK